MKGYHSFYAVNTGIDSHSQHPLQVEATSLLERAATGYIRSFIFPRNKQTRGKYNSLNLFSWSQNSLLVVEDAPPSHQPRGVGYTGCEEMGGH